MTHRQFLTSRRSIRVMLAIALVGSLAAAGAGLTTATKTPEDRGGGIDPQDLVPVPVRSVTPTSSYLTDRSFTGMVVARRTSELGFERAAEVVEILVDQGDWVSRGDPLARLDLRQLTIAKQRTTAERDQAVAILQELQAGPRPQTIRAARARVRELEADVELKQRSFKRTRALLDQNAASKERYDELELGLRSAEARLAMVGEELAELEAGTRVERIAAQKAVVAQLDAQLADLEIEISDSTLQAPYDGQIAERFIDEGTVVAASQSILKIVERAALEAQIGLPIETAASLELEQSATVMVGRQRWPVVVDRLLPEVDLQTRTQIAVFRFGDDASPRVVPGQVARIEIEQTRQASGYWVPTTSLVRGFRGLWAVYVVDAGASDDRARVARRDVEVLHTEGSSTLVRGTLAEGDRVITSGTQRVVPGQRVQIIESPSDESSRG